ncbi:MAG: hypothetical protein ACYTG1_10390 [Planctomycetota bacterium]|jgi:hypothetical protein
MARLLVRGLCDAFADVVEAATGQIPGPSDLGRLLGVDRKLSWKVSRIVQTSDVFSIVSHIPGASGVGIFLDAAARRGVSPGLLARARAAVADFERLIDVHAGDRASLEMMARGYVDDASEQAEINRRRDAFAGHSYTWGVQARTQLSANIVFPSEARDEVDVVLLSGLIDLRRLRPKVAWVVARLGFVDGHGLAEPGESVPPPPIPLLESFSSTPTALRSFVTPSGQVEIELDEGPVGDTGAMTCFFCGDVIRRAGSRFRTEEDPDADLNVHVRTPTRVLVHDLVVHADLFGRLEPSAAVYSEVHEETRAGRTRDQRHRLPVPLAVEHLGRGPSALRTSDVPRYPEMARHVLERTG